MDRTSENDTILPAELSSVPLQNVEKLMNNLASKSRRLRNKKNDSFTKQHQRDNKNRPREVSSKKPIKDSFSKPLSTVQVKRDPRFEDSCGTFSQRAFNENYKFLNNIKKKERKLLYKQLKHPETSLEEREKIKIILQRQENQLREMKKKDKEMKLINEKRNYEISQLKQGKTPFYHKKSAQKLLQLAEQFEDLKKKGSLNKHMKRRRKKKAGKDKQKIDISV